MIKQAFIRLGVALSVLTIALLSLSATADNRIVDGKNTSQGKYPWMVALTLTGETAFDGFQCGASLIAPNWVITAAHCVRFTSPSDIEVIINRANLESRNGERIGVKRIIGHPVWNTLGFFDVIAHDIALLELTRSSNVRPVKLITAESRLDRAGAKATVMGWGRTRFQGIQRVLQHVDLPIMSHSYCANIYKQQSGTVIYDDLHICAGYKRGGRNACNGDSGGPLLVNDPASGEDTLVGIVSFGPNSVCSQRPRPEVYARVKTQRDWIDRQINGLATPTETSDLNPIFAKIDYACSGLTCVVDGRRSGNNESPIVNYSWDMGDGTTQRGPVIRHTYLRTGIDTVILTATRADGTSDKAYRRLRYDQSTANDRRRLTKRYTGDFHFSDDTDQIVIPRKRAETGMWIHDGPLSAEITSDSTVEVALALERFNETSLSWEQIAMSESISGRHIIEVTVNGGFHRLVVRHSSGFGLWSTTMTANRAARQ